MTRLRTTVLLLLVSVLALSACSDVTGGAAATVDGRDIDDGDFRARLEQLAEQPEAAARLIGVPVHADGQAVEGRVDAAFAASVLELEILLDLIDAEADARGVEVTDADLDETRGRLDPALAAELEALPEDLAIWFLTWNTQAGLLQEQLASEVEVAEVTDEDVQAYYDENTAAFEGVVCASHVLVETEDEAQQVLADLDGGAELAEVASERSIDPSAATNGGDLGCSDPSRFVEPFAEAISDGEIGEYLGPVETDFGFHVILVRSRGTAPFEEVEADIRAQLEAESQSASGNALGTFLQEAVSGADVSVNSRYGTWNAESGQVTPPEGPAGETPTLSLG